MNRGQTMPAIAKKNEREFTGWHMLALTVSAFGVIIAVNGVMAYKAISTFPGLEVQSSYLASQDFDAEKAAQVALGWVLTPSYDPVGGVIRLQFQDKAGQAVTLGDLSVLVGRPTEARDDRTPDFVPGADGVYQAQDRLAVGKWMVDVTAHAQDGTLFHQRLDLHVKG
jgi:nitrogen fixation protein FixH